MITEIDIYKDALTKIARHALRRKMLKHPPSIKEFYDELCIGSRNELAEIFEMLGEIANAALEDGDSVAKLRR